MSFLYNNVKLYKHQKNIIIKLNKIKNLNKKNSLQVQMQEGIENRYIEDNHIEKASSSATFEKSASMTVEAALVLPIFILICSCFLYLGLFMNTQLKLQTAMEETGRKAASYLYVTKLLENNDSKLLDTTLKKLAFQGITVPYIKSQIIEIVNPIWLKNSCIKDGDISLIGTNILADGENIDIVVTYKIEFPYIPISIGKNAVVQRCKRRAWIGQTSNNEEEKTTEQIVYVTTHGTVYHKTLSCTHLKLSITPVNFNSVSSLRNENGAKYYGCEYCIKKKSTGTVYITKQGDRYHSKNTCPKLSRGIKSIKISQVGNKKACSRCGNKK